MADGTAIPLLFSAALVGLIVGSFLNVVIYRVPLQLQRAWQRDARHILGLEPAPATRDEFNVIVPASRCPHCQTAIRPWQNIPLVSYLLLKGRCAQCKTRISPQYPLVELVAAVLTVAVVAAFGFTLEGILLLVFTWSLLALTGIDFNTQLLPDAITLPLLWLGLLANTRNLFVPLADAVLGAAAGYLMLWSVYWLFRALTGKEGMGHGDFKLLAALGAWLGWQMLPLIILLASAVGALVGVMGICLLGRDRQVAIAFGPYLAAAGWLALLWGQDILAAWMTLW